MQNKIHSIKERIKEISIKKGIPIGKYFSELEISSSGFSGEKLKKGVNSDVIQKIICKYPDVDLLWLITGEYKNETTKDHLAMEDQTHYGKNYKDLYLEVLEENRGLSKKVIGLIEDNNLLKKK
jgi:hypothetical protein